MLNELVNRLRGQLRIRAESAFPERILNLCGARELAFWDVEWESPTAFTCRLSRQDWHALRQAAKNLDCTLTVIKREGAPYFLFRFRRRQALLIGLALCAMWLSVGSFFVWDFVVEGNETVPTEEILRALEKNDVHLGSFGLALDGERIRNHVVLDIPELSWITVNVSGCRANVQVRERVPVPERVDRQIPSNVVARRAGLVLKVRATDGVSCVQPGTAVTEGQLLISGIEDTDTVGARVLAGLGSVTARTWRTLTAAIPLEAMQKEYTGEAKNLFSLVIGKHRINFFTNSSIEGAEYDKICRRYPLSLFGLRLPLTLVTETCRFYALTPVTRDTAEAEREGERILTEYLQSAVEPYGSVSSTLCTSRQREGVLLVTLAAECVEEIGVRLPIYTEEPGPSPDPQQ